MTKARCIKTLDYGVLPIAYSTKWLNSEVVTIIEGCGDDVCYEIRTTHNGQLVAYKMED